MERLYDFLKDLVNMQYLVFYIAFAVDRKAFILDGISEYGAHMCRANKLIRPVEGICLHRQQLQI